MLSKARWQIWYKCTFLVHFYVHCIMVLPKIIWFQMIFASSSVPVIHLIHREVNFGHSTDYLTSLLHLKSSKQVFNRLKFSKGLSSNIPLDNSSVLHAEWLSIYLANRLTKIFQQIFYHLLLIFKINCNSMIIK